MADGITDMALPPRQQRAARPTDAEGDGDAVPPVWRQIMSAAAVSPTQGALLEAAAGDAQQPGPIASPAAPCAASQPPAVAELVVDIENDDGATHLAPHGGFARFNAASPWEECALAPSTALNCAAACAAHLCESL